MARPRRDTWSDRKSWRVMMLVVALVFAVWASGVTYYSFTQNDRTHDLTLQTRDLALQNRKLVRANADVAKQAKALAKQGKGAHDALCILRNDLARRVKDSQAFLREHPIGIPGIPAKTIQSSIANQEATLSALGGLRCPKDFG